MKVQCRRSGQCLIVGLSGEMDHHASDIARRKIDDAYMMQGTLHIVFDCHELDFMDSSGLGLIMGRYKTASSLGGRVVLAGVSPKLDRIFTLSGLYKIIEKAPDAVAAVKRLEGGRHHV